MDFGLAFSYPFQDKDWIQKILLTGVISLIPIVGQIAVLGWLIEITARVIRGESDPMPKWEDFGGLFMSGLKAFALGFIFGLPLMIIAFPAAIIDMLVDSESAAVVFSLLLACLSCLSIIYGLALAFRSSASWASSSRAPMHMPSKRTSSVKPTCRPPRRVSAAGRAFRTHAAEAAPPRAALLLARA